MEFEGVIDIFQLDRPVAPEAGTYRVSFIPYQAGGGSYGGRLCEGWDEVRALLVELRVHGNIMAEALDHVRQTSGHHIPNVRLTTQQIKVARL